MNKMTKINKTIKKAKATLLMLLSIQTSLPLGGLGWALSSCSDFLYDDSDQVIYADDHSLSSDADTLWSMAGIMNKMQAVADRTILLGEVRGDLVSLTANAPADLRQLANFSLTSTPSPLTSTPSPLTSNKYNQPRDYYAVINNCNYFIARADTALRDGRNEYIFRKEYAAAKAFRAWTYLQLALNYRQVPFITEPILTEEQSEQQFPMYDLVQVCQYFINDLAPYVDVETPGYQSIRSTDSKLFYFPINILLGDLNLWAGNYRAAAESYYRYLSTRNGSNSTYPISTNAVRFVNSDSRWMTTRDTWSTSSFQSETFSANGELITMIPGDSIPSEGNYSELRDLFNTTENNEYRSSIVPSQAIKNISHAQKYCQFTGNQFILAPDALDDEYKGDLRLRSAYQSVNNASAINIVLPNGRRIESYSSFAKYQTRNVHLYRRSMVYLRLAEALNRAGYPRFAFQILKRGLNNSIIATEVLPYYAKSDSAWIASFNFDNRLYVLETTAGNASENTMGLHGRGCGYAAYDTTYVMPDDSTLAGAARLQYQMERVEDLIIDEEALELAFEGHRFYDLMRVALRRNDPGYLARRVAMRSGTLNASLLSILSDTNNWYLNIED